MEKSHNKSKFATSVCSTLIGNLISRIKLEKSNPLYFYHFSFFIGISPYHIQSLLTLTSRWLIMAFQLLTHISISDHDIHIFNLDISINGHDISIINLNISITDLDISFSNLDISNFVMYWGRSTKTGSIQLN